MEDWLELTAGGGGGAYGGGTAKNEKKYDSDDKILARLCLYLVMLEIYVY